MNFKYFQISVLLTLLLIFGCQPKKSITQNKQFENETWNAFDYVDFSTNIADPDNAYQIKIQLILSEKFIQNEFSFGLSQKNEDGESIYSHHTIPVRNAQGELDGEMKDGYYYYSLLTNNKTYFNSMANYTFSIESTIGKYEVNGVKEISLEIEQL